MILYVCSFGRRVEEGSDKKKTGRKGAMYCIILYNLYDRLGRHDHDHDFDQRGVPRYIFARPTRNETARQAR
jgi:hypothetical protein